MASALRVIGHEDRLSLVDHLDELRTRLIVAVAALVVAFGVCLWQNGPLLHVVNKPLDRQTQKAIQKGRGPLGEIAITQQAVRALAQASAARDAVLSRPDSGLAPAVRRQLQASEAQLQSAVARLPRTPSGNKPVTLGVGEPFSSTVTVALYFAVLFAAPVILFQLYAFILPAFSPRERKVAFPLMLSIPVLFIAGVVFGYFIVLPAAVKFLQNFNSDSFNVLVQARDYYRFVALTLVVLGLVFQVPVGILAAVQSGVVTPKQLRANRRYAIVLAAVVAAIAPGDLITMILEMLPILVLYELSILVASVIVRRAERAHATEAGGASASP
ncbi:MAG: twin-arginine translocase subunit TatC [Actinobacteria bacterium]|nr:MAG: twin-arginine translocase subunit TatC [Actinomycetota bacterium]